MSDDEGRREELDPPPEEESSGDAALDARLAEPILKGMEGLDKAQVGISAFLILVAGAVAFSNTLSIPFHYGDQVALVEHTGLHRVATIPDGWDAYAIRPITALTLALNWWLGGGSPWAFHFVNLCLHLGSGILVYFLCRGLLRGKAPEAVSMTGGMLFVLHPAVTQAVNYVALRSALLSTFFILLCAALYVRAVTGDKAPRVGPLVLSVLAFTLAWSSDVSAWIVPVLLLLLDVAVRRGAGLLARARCLAPYWGLLALFLIAHGVSGTASEQFLTPGQVFAQAGTVLEQLKLIAYPVGQSVEHGPLGDAQAPLLWGALLLIGVGLMKFRPVPGVALTWFALAVAAPGLFRADASFEEARIYFPLAGAALLVPWLLNAVPGQPLRVAAGIATAALIVTAGTLTYMRNQVWQSEVSLWSDAGEQCADCPAPPARLGAVHLAQAEQALDGVREAFLREDREEAARLQGVTTSELEEAEALLSLASLHEEAPGEVWYALGKAQRFLGNTDAALVSARKALMADLASQDYTLQVALLLEALARQSGSAADTQRAMDYYRRAEDLGPLSGDAALRFGTLLARIRDLRASESLLSSVVSDDAPAAKQTLAQVRSGIQSIATIQSTIDQRVKANPADPAILGLKARQLFLDGRPLQSAYLVEARFRNVGMDPDLWMLLGFCKAKMGAYDGFLEEYSSAFPGESGASVWRELAQRCAMSGDWDAALATLRKSPVLPDHDSSPLLSLAAIALEAGDVPRALSLLQQAAAAAPEDPESWLRMCDLAEQAKQPGTAKRYLAEAQKRGAMEADMAERIERVGKPDAGQRTRTFIR